MDLHYGKYFFNCGMMLDFKWYIFIVYAFFHVLFLVGSWHMLYSLYIKEVVIKRCTFFFFFNKSVILEKKASVTLGSHLKPIVSLTPKIPP